MDSITEILAAFLLNIIHSVLTNHILSCDPEHLEPCPDSTHMICNGTSHQCQCLPEYQFVEDKCEIQLPDDGSFSRELKFYSLLVTLILIVCALFLIIKRYKLVQVLQQKLNYRQSSNIVYEDVMIGSDVPPIDP